MEFYNRIRPKPGNFGIILRHFSSSNVNYKDNLKNARKFNPSSQNWLLRQINDKYVKQAKMDHYRCRSAFKLVEMQQKYKILRPGQAVVDLGCAPGSWTQVAVKATQANSPESCSLVVGVDLSPVHPLEGATLLRGDLTAESCQQQLVEALQGRPVNVVLSDMSPTASGIKSLDHTNIIKLCYVALSFAKKTSGPGATLIMKLFDGAETKQLIADAKSMYQVVRNVRPEATRTESSEMFLLCLDFKERPSQS